MKPWHINRKGAWQKAGYNELIELNAPIGLNPLFYKKKHLHLIALSISDGSCVHLSGGSGTGKTSLIFALSGVPKNWNLLCEHNGIEKKPLRVFHLAAYNYDAPNEVWYRRAINETGTFDELQKLIEFLQYAIQHKDEAYYAIHIMEVGRMKSEIQHALVHLITKGDIINPLTGESLGAVSLAFLADSNYAAADTHDFILADKDTALFNRINENGIRLDHLQPEEEAMVLRSIKKSIGAEDVSDDLIEKITFLGSMMRKEQLNNGVLNSVSPVSMRQYIAFLKKASKSDLPPEDLVDCTLFALSNEEDQAIINELKSDVFGIEKYKYSMDEFDEIAF